MASNDHVQAIIQAVERLRAHGEEDAAAALERASQWLQQNAASVEQGQQAGTAPGQPQPGAQQTNPQTGDQGATGQAVPAQQQQTGQAAQQPPQTGQAPQGGLSS